MRYEMRDNNYDFNSGVNGPQDGAYLLQRFRLGVGYDINPWIKLYVQGQDVREIGGDRGRVIGVNGAQGDDVFDVLKAYVQIGNLKKGFSSVIGRQFLSFGDQRLLGPLEWANQARSFDAARFRYTADMWSLDMFIASPVNYINGQWDKSDFLTQNSPRNAWMDGIYLSTLLVPFNTTTDFYVFHNRDNGTATFGTPIGSTSFVTLGTLWKGDPKKLNGFDYDTEMDFQTGKVGGRALTAYAGHWGVGYNWLKSPWKPRIGTQLNYASGDGNSKDGKIGTFQNLYPTNHLFYGYMDTTAWMNVINPQLNFSFSPSSRVKVMLDYHLYWNANNADNWYLSNGTVKVRPVSTSALNASSFRGQEFDFTVSCKVTPHINFLSGYSYFIAGDYLRQTGTASNAQFGYVQMQIDF
jgi:Alginate export